MKMTRVLLLVLLIAPIPAFALDWPQWRGPERTDVSQETGLLKEWPKDGPKLVWSIDQAGVGYTAPAIVGDRLYISGAFDGKEVLYALDASKGGKKLWSTEIGPLFDNPWGSGPRATPTVDDQLIYAMGGAGGLLCAEVSTGKKVWSVDLKKDLGGEASKYAAYWGYTEAPLIDGDRVIVTPGGSKGTLVALDKKTGKLIWRTTEWTDTVDYNSAVKHTVGGVPMIVQMTAASVVGVSPADGSVLWSFPRKAKITIDTPICFGNYVYVSSSYNEGCDLIELKQEGKKFTAKSVYTDEARKVMQNHHGGVILVDGHMFGFNDGSKSWTCQDAKTGKAVWTSRALGKGSITYADGHFYCLSEDKGTCVLIDATTTGWKERGRFDMRLSKLPRAPRNSSNVWTHPVIANGRLYLRDQEQLYCYDVKDVGR
jgi:outer membrane protein assembly factor BamB